MTFFRFAIRPLFSLAAVFFLLAGPNAFAQPATQPAETQPASKPAESVGDPYTLGTCPVSGEELGSMGDPIIREYDGREVRFCCSGCIKRFENDRPKYTSKIDEQIIEQQKGVYPLTSCVVMDDEPLAEVEKERTYYVYNNRLFVLCCEGCKKEIMLEPEKYMKKLDAAVVAAQAKDYPTETCLVSGEKLGDHGKPVDYVIANRLIRLCCKDCIPAVEKDPAKYISMIDKLRGIESAPAPTTQPAAAPARTTQPAAAPDPHKGHNH